MIGQRSLAESTGVPRLVGSRRRRSAPVLWALFLSCCLLTPTALGIGSAGTRILLGGIGVMVAVVVSTHLLLQDAGRRPGDWWLQPSALFLVVAALSFGAAPLAWMGSNVEVNRFFSGEDVALAQVVGLVGIWSIVGGVLWARRRVGQPLITNRLGLEPRFASANVVAFSVGIAAMLLLAGMQRFSYLGDPEAALAARSSIPQILGILSSLALYGAAMTFWGGLVTPSRRQVVLGILMGTTLIVLGFVGGSKQPVVIPAVALLAVLRIARGPLSKRLVALMLMAAALLFFFNPLYRSNLRGEGLAPAPAFDQALDDTVGAVVEAPATVLGEGFQAVYRRLRNVDSTAIIISRTPGEIPYRTLWSVPVGVGSALIPRFLWPGKPPVSDGYEFALEYYERDPSIYSATAVTLFGGLYRHGGLLVLAVGGLLLGWYLSLLDRVANPLVSPGGLLPFLALVVPLAKAESGVPVTIAGQLQGGLVIVVFMLILLAPNRDPARSRERWSR